MTALPRRRRPPLLAVLAELYASVEERDEGNVGRLCELEARRLPREVREEAMAVARTPAAGHRAPVRLLMFWRAARVLEAERAVRAAERLVREQLELDFGGRRERRVAARRVTTRPELRLERRRFERRDDVEG